MILGAAVLVVIAVVAFYVTQSGNNVNIQASGTPTGTQPATAVRNADLMIPGPLGDMALGDPNAPNVIIEYASMTCPPCQRWHSDIYPKDKCGVGATPTFFINGVKVEGEQPLDAIEKRLVS